MCTYTNKTEMNILAGIKHKRTHVQIQQKYTNVQIQQKHANVQIHM